MAQLSVTYSFSPGATIVSSQVNQNFTDIVNWANGNVGTDNLTALSVTAAKIAADAVTTSKILDSNVTTAKINDLAVTTGKINDLAVTAGKIASDAVTTAKILDANVTRAKLVAVGQQISSSTSTFSTTSTSFTDITNATVTITTTGRPVVLALVSDGSGNNAYIQGVSSNTGTAAPSFDVKILQDSTVIGNLTFVAWSYAAQVGPSILWSPSAIYHFYAPAAGTYTFKLQAKVNNAVTTAYFLYCKLIAYEL